MSCAALAGIEDYARVDLLAVADATVRGQGAPDVPHLPAELLEAATRLRPNTPASTRPTPCWVDDFDRPFVLGPMS